jgi:hypothetical protein
MIEQEASPDTPIVLRIRPPIVPKGNLNIALPMSEGFSVGEELAALVVGARSRTNVVTECQAWLGPR